MKKILAFLSSGVVLFCCLFSLSSCRDRLTDEEETSSTDATTERIYIHHEGEGDPVVWDGVEESQPETTTEDGATIYWVWTPAEFKWIMNTDNLNAAAQESDIIIRIGMCFDFDDQNTESPGLLTEYVGGHTVTFEGNGHTFYQMKKEGNSQVGLFGYFYNNDASTTRSTLNIENITLDQANFTATGHGPLGAFLAYTQPTYNSDYILIGGCSSLNVHITNCHVKNSNLVNQDDTVGGIASNLDEALNAFTMTGCSVEDTNIVAEYAGGLLGEVSMEENADGPEFVVDGCSLSNVKIISYGGSDATWDTTDPLQDYYKCYVGQLVSKINKLATVKVTGTSINSVNLHLYRDSELVTPDPNTDRKVGYIYKFDSTGTENGHLYIGSEAEDYNPYSSN